MAARSSGISCVLAIAALLSGRMSLASDHLNLEPNLPLQVEDAYPIAVGGREVQGFVRYEKTGEHADKLTTQPRMELGIFANTQLSIEAPFYCGEADKTGSGDISLELFYNFNQETRWLPALALSGRLEFPSGYRNEGIDTELKFIATKTIDPEHLRRIHLNLSWTHNAAPASDERHDLYAAVLGYSFRLGPDTLMIADCVHQTGREKHTSESILELGIRQQLTPQLVLTFGAGVGLGDDSPDFRITPGFQWSF